MCGAMMGLDIMSWSTRSCRSAHYEPKTAASKRTIDLTPELVHALKLWKLACPKGPLNLVFPNLDGSPRRRTTIK
jgi:integrase